MSSDALGMTWFVGWVVISVIAFIVGVSGATRSALDKTVDPFAWNASEWAMGSVIAVLCGVFWPLALLALPAALIAAPQAILIKRKQRREEQAEQQRKALRDAARLFPAGSDERRLLMQAAEEES